jgi:oligopeptide transport system ATP-binding protein
VSETLLRVRDLVVDHRVSGAGHGWRTGRIRALDGVDLAVRERHALGIVGESGSGKSTLARAILGLVPATAGSIEWRGRPTDGGDAQALAQLRREAQIVFQDPVGSLDPRMTVAQSVGEALRALGGPVDREAGATRIAASLEEVGLGAALADRYPHQLSGGQCQRAAIARATVARPRLLICDEAVSALDVSVQAQVLNLLQRLSRQHGMSLLFISHNLAVVRHVCDEVLVLFRGRVVERARRDALFGSPQHPYTRALLSAVPRPDPGVAPAAEPVPADVMLAGTDHGCAYRHRCPLADGVCAERSPGLREGSAGRFVACHHT